MLVKLKNELLGGEFNILDFDNKMENLNFLVSMMHIQKNC